MAIYVAGWREEALAQLVKEYKYQAVWANTQPLTELLDSHIPHLPVTDDIIVVPLPTIGRHVRERGIDHTLKLAKALAKRRGWKCRQLLVRAKDTVQVGAKAAERQTQAEGAYEAIGTVEPGATYLLLDDIWTTGASLMAAGKAMQAAGAQKLLAAVLAIGKPKVVEAGTPDTKQK